VGSNPTQGMDVCVVYYIFVLFCVQIAVLRRADLPSKESYGLCVGLRKRKKAKIQRAVEPYIYIIVGNKVNPDSSRIRFYDNLFTSSAW
jgi:hypothetical protein